METAYALRTLAGLYQAQGRYDEAEPLYQRSLMIKKRAIGREHPEVATQRSLMIKKRAIGGEHPEVATTLNNLAGLYRAQAVPSARFELARQQAEREGARQA